MGVTVSDMGGGVDVDERGRARLVLYRSRGNPAAHDPVFLGNADDPAERARFLDLVRAARGGEDAFVAAFRASYPEQFARVQTWPPVQRSRLAEAVRLTAKLFGVG